MNELALLEIAIKLLGPVGGVLLVPLIYMFRRDRQSRDDMKEMADKSAERERYLVDVIREMSKDNQEIIRGVTERLARLEVKADERKSKKSR